ncbi:MAG: rhodanese-like domain-containing protein [Acidobacteria bacterium]|nr:rhodanese-like domain-containing protein [Acidobacteriota bacterium]MCB9378617.1 rhodanese-like domain-containing protein [Holophagales bacterium]
MGPFVPDLISDQLNLVVALALGFLFGYVLEQAGFSSSRRLVGVFYGYDLTVLRVFFTAAVTAALGVLLLGAFGRLDLSIIFVNSTWLWPAIVGGALMGLGFLLGGYCPGTSFCGAAIGKVDAIVFTFGGFLGIFAYAELYPRLEPFADSTAMGPVLLPNLLGISPGLFVLLLAAVAVIAFAVGGKVERKVAPAAAPSAGFRRRRHLVAAAILFAVAIPVALLPARADRLHARVTAPGYTPRHAVHPMTPDELAYRLVDRDPRLRVLDLRSEAERSAHPMPGAIAVPRDQILGKAWRHELSGRHVAKVIVATDEQEARIAAYLLAEGGIENLSILAGGFPAFESAILEDGTAPETGRYAGDVARFRARARTTLAERLRVEREAPVKVAKAPKAIKGGC